MANLKVRRKTTKNVKKPESVQAVGGEAAAAAKNSQRKARLGVVDAYRRLSIELPDFVKAFRANPHLQYFYQIAPQPFQAPDFDPLNQSPEDWAKVANQAWEKHRNGFLQKCESWVEIGVDEKIEATNRVRGPGERGSTKAGSRKRRDNTPIDKRYEWAAKYLAGDQLKTIAGPGDDPSIVGRIVRDVLRQAGWIRKPKSNKRSPTP